MTMLDLQDPSWQPFLTAYAQLFAGRNPRDQQAFLASPSHPADVAIRIHQVNDWLTSIVAETESESGIRLPAARPPLEIRQWVTTLDWADRVQVELLSLITNAAIFGQDEDVIKNLHQFLDRSIEINIPETD